MLTWLLNRGGSDIKILRKGRAQRVLFYMDGENGSTMDDVQVTLYENGIVMIDSQTEESTTDIRNVEIFWRIGPLDQGDSKEDVKVPSGRVVQLRPEMSH